MPQVALDLHFSAQLVFNLGLLQLTFKQNFQRHYIFALHRNVLNIHWGDKNCKNVLNNPINRRIEANVSVKFSFYHFSIDKTIGLINYSHHLPKEHRYTSKRRTLQQLVGQERQECWEMSCGSHWQLRHMLEFVPNIVFLHDLFCVDMW